MTEVGEPSSEPAEPAVPESPIIGLIPAAGRASRLSNLPCSKEIFPIFESDAEGRPSPSPVCAGLLRGMASAGIERVLIVLRDGKWDVASRLCEGSEWGVDLGYLSVASSTCVPETLGRALPWCKGADVALGFPDILLRPTDIWQRLSAFHRRHSGAVSLGLFPTDQVAKADMVDFEPGGNGEGRATRIVIKDPSCELRWTWSIAIWRPIFSTFLADWLKNREQPRPGSPEPYIGDVFRAAMEEGLVARTLSMEDGSFLDVGTPEDLARAVGAGAKSSTTDGSSFKDGSSPKDGSFPKDGSSPKDSVHGDRAETQC